MDVNVFFFVYFKKGLIVLVPYQNDTPKNSKGNIKESGKKERFASSLPDLCEDDEEEYNKQSKNALQLIFFRILGNFDLQNLLFINIIRSRNS